MIAKDIIDKVLQSHRDKQPFVAFSSPESNQITFYFQKNSSEFIPDDFEENGFVMHPFNNEEEAYFITKKSSEIFECPIKASFDEFDRTHIEVNDSEKEAHISLVAKAVSEIKKKRTSKIVVSREQKIPLERFNIETLFNRIFSLSTNTMRYIWYHPKTHIWCGATPELLLKTEEACFKTMALAGTRPYLSNSNVVGWSEKELHEHQLVVDDIVGKLQKAVTVLKMSKRSTHRAGPVVHLRTDIRGCFKKGKASLPAIAKLLHPTPAVCGTPQSEAFDFIKETENYNRQFYTGYLGCFNDKSKDSFLFVNLRCMKIENDIAHVFVGGGITKESTPEDEWDETQNKLQTMLQVLQPML